MAQAFILAAGFGTRLRPLTAHRPKPLVPICGVPLLSYSLALCARYGLTEVIVNAHWLPEQLTAWAGAQEGCEVVVVVEREILGTGGGLRGVRRALDERFAVLNGDILHNVDLSELLHQVPAGGGAMALRPDAEHAERYGVVAADGEARVVRLVHLAEARAHGPVREDTHFTGVHALDRRALDLVPEGFACVVRSAYQALVPERLVGAVRYTGPWLDAGDPPSYLAANLAVLRGELELALDPFGRAGWGQLADGSVVGDASLVAGVETRGAVWVGAGAKIAPGVVLEDTVVGPGAVVAAGAALRCVVVWDGVEVPGVSLSEVVAFDGGRLECGHD